MVNLALQSAAEESLLSGSEAQKVGKILFGRYMLPDKSEHSCSVIGFSLDAAFIRSDGYPAPGDRIILYLEHFGRLEGIASNPVNGGFSVRFILQGDRKSKLVQKFEWLLLNEAGEVENERQYNRRQLHNSFSRLTLLDGRVLPCEVTDVSMTGGGRGITLILMGCQGLILIG